MTSATLNEFLRARNFSIHIAIHDLDEDIPEFSELAFNPIEIRDFVKSIDGFTIVPFDPAVHYPAHGQSLVEDFDGEDDDMEDEEFAVHQKDGPIIAQPSMKWVTHPAQSTVVDFNRGAKWATPAAEIQYQHPRDAKYDDVDFETDLGADDVPVAVLTFDFHVSKDTLLQHHLMDNALVTVQIKFHNSSGKAEVAHTLFGFLDESIPTSTSGNFGSTGNLKHAARFFITDMTLMEVL